MVDGRDVTEQRLSSSRSRDHFGFVLREQGQEIRSRDSDRSLQLTVWLKTPSEQMHNFVHGSDVTVAAV